MNDYRFSIAVAVAAILGYAVALVGGIITLTLYASQAVHSVSIQSCHVGSAIGTDRMESVCSTARIGGRK